MGSGSGSGIEGAVPDDGGCRNRRKEPFCGQTTINSGNSSTCTGSYHRSDCVIVRCINYTEG